MALMFTVYILYSKYLQKYYIGYTSQVVQERLDKHLANHKGFTGRAKDWQIVYENTLEEKQEALKLEKQIKKRGAKRFLTDNGYRVTH